MTSVQHPRARVLDTPSRAREDPARGGPRTLGKVTMAVTFFDAFTPQEVARICAVGTQLKLPEGWSPIAEQTPADKAYIVLEGTVSVRRDGEEVAQLGSGDIVGEAAILGRTLRNASIVALTPLEVIHLTAEALRELSEDMPSFRSALDEVAQQRLG